jgi:hypothetical protein
MASYREENPGRNKYPPLSAHVLLSRKGMLNPGGATPKILISILATNPTYILHTMLEDIQKCWGIFAVFDLLHYMLLSHGSQAVQTSRFSVARVPMNTCEM